MLDYRRLEACGQSLPAPTRSICQSTRCKRVMKIGTETRATWPARGGTKQAAKLPSRHVVMPSRLVTFLEGTRSHSFSGPQRKNNEPAGSQYHVPTRFELTLTLQQTHHSPNQIFSRTQPASQVPSSSLRLPLRRPNLAKGLPTQSAVPMATSS